MAELTRQDAEKLVEAIGIPPRPAVVMAIMAEKGKDEPDFKAIADAIALDVGVSAALLKTVNSPFFGLRRSVQSIPQAVSILGLSRLATLVTSLALRASITSEGCEGCEGIESFWDQSARVAMICAWLAAKLKQDQDSAHLFGLFQNAGMPLLMRRFPDYHKTLGQISEDAGAQSFIAMEEARHGVNHGIVGSIVARNWLLPDHLRAAIRHHHDPDVFGSEALATGVKDLVAIGHLASQIESLHSHDRDDGEWRRFKPDIVAWLMLEEDDVTDFMHEASALLVNSGL